MAGLPATGPPLGICPLVPAALIVTEGLRLCSWYEAEFIALFPLTIVGPPREGTAGEIKLLPFDKEVESDLPCATPPAEAEGFWECVAAVFFVALA